MTRDGRKKKSKLFVFSLHFLLLPEPFVSLPFLPLPFVRAVYWGAEKFSAYDKHYSEVRFCLTRAMERNCVQCYYSAILWPVSAFYHLIGSHTKGLWDFHLAAAWWQRRNKNCALLHSQGWDVHPICTLPRHLFPSPFPMHNGRPIECLFFFHFQANPLHWFCFKANPPWFLIVDLRTLYPLTSLGQNKTGKFLILPYPLLIATLLILIYI